MTVLKEEERDRRAGVRCNKKDCPLNHMPEGSLMKEVWEKGQLRASTSLSP